jgi:hypothetical protein
MIKDRGNIKWTSLMLTEHREALEKILKRDNDVEKPELDEQQLERLDILLKEAIRDQFSVKILYHENKRMNIIEGKISIRKNQLYLNDKPILLDNIIDIKLL